MGKSLNQPKQLWDWSTFEMVATDRTAEGSHHRSKGQETSIWGVECDSHHHYHIVPNTAHRGVGGEVAYIYATSICLKHDIYNPFAT